MAASGLGEGSGGPPVIFVSRPGIQTPLRQRLLVLRLGEAHAALEWFAAGVLFLLDSGFPRVVRWGGGGLGNKAGRARRYSSRSAAVERAATGLAMMYDPRWSHCLKYRLYWSRGRAEEALAEREVRIVLIFPAVVYRCRFGVHYHVGHP